jgi:hypothetical protein
MWHERGRRKVHTGCWWRKLKAKDELEEVGIDTRIKLKHVKEIG